MQLASRHQLDFEFVACSDGDNMEYTIIDIGEEYDNTRAMDFYSAAICNLAPAIVALAGFVVLATMLCFFVRL